jgi:hypothetical protein
MLNYIVEQWRGLRANPRFTCFGYPKAPNQTLRNSSPGASFDIGHNSIRARSVGIVRQPVVRERDPKLQRSPAGESCWEASRGCTSYYWTDRVRFKQVPPSSTAISLT